MTEALTRFVKDDAGQDLIEYGLLVGIITSAVVAAIAVISTKVQNYFNTLTAHLP